MGPDPTPLILGKKKEIIREEGKVCRVSKKSCPPLPSRLVQRSGSAARWIEMSACKVKITTTFLEVVQKVKKSSERLMTFQQLKRLIVMS